MMSILSLFEVLISIPKTIYFNFRFFPIRVAVKLPIYVHYDVKIRQTRKSYIELPENIRTFMIKFGYSGTLIIPPQKALLLLKGGTLAFQGNASFGKGNIIECGGRIEIGAGFTSNNNLTLSCNKKMIFGKDTMIGWNVVIRDSDGHTVVNAIKENEIMEFGEHVWICAEAHIIKPVMIGNGCVIGYKSLVNKSCASDGVLFAGFPAKIVKEIEWKR